MALRARMVGGGGLVLWGQQVTLPQTHQHNRLSTYVVHMVLMASLTKGRIVVDVVRKHTARTTRTIIAAQTWF